jgi:hypothetical protein
MYIKKSNAIPVCEVARNVFVGNGQQKEGYSNMYTVGKKRMPSQTSESAGLTRVVGCSVLLTDKRYP